MNPFTTSCQLCGSRFRFGPHVYNGKVVASYKLTLCDACYAGNCDGYAPHYEARLEGHWSANGIPIPSRNANGLYPRGG